MNFKHTSLPIENELPKLVRDNIIEQINTSNKTNPVFHVAKSDTEYDFFLKKKIIEESVEVNHAENRDELVKEISDVLEIIDSLKELHKINDLEINTVKAAKKDKNGGFTKRHILDINQ